mmetsp:Transcript_30830/g.92387  ORF Transcript_30830/g.92387 Transcript_30830/m.92387 type:complete len:85 (+) Transcript_30830:158-412(+)
MCTPQTSPSKRPSAESPEKIKTPTKKEPQTPSQKKRSEEEEILAASPSAAKRSPPPSGEKPRAAKSPKNSETLKTVSSPKPLSI